MKIVSSAHLLESKVVKLARTSQHLLLTHKEISPVFIEIPSLKWLSLRQEYVRNSVEMESGVCQLSVMMGTRLVMTGAVMIAELRRDSSAREDLSLLLTSAKPYKLSLFSQSQSHQVGLSNYN